MLRVDVVDDVNVNTEAILKGLIWSLWSGFHVGIFLMHPTVLTGSILSNK